MHRAAIEDVLAAVRLRPQRHHVVAASLREQASPCST